VIKPKKTVGRQGKPFTLYLPKDQAQQLDVLARKRSIAKATLVRYAVGRLLDDVNGGQLQLPLGIQ
jgi:hypothetical protein